MGTIPPSSRGDKDVERRSQRVMLKVSVVVLAHGADNKRVSEETRTVTVNAHGAMILLGMYGIHRTSTSASAFRHRRGSVVPSRVSQPSSIREARSGSRFYQTLPRILAHFLSST